MPKKEGCRLIVSRQHQLKTSCFTASFVQAIYSHSLHRASVQRKWQRHISNHVTANLVPDQEVRNLVPLLRSSLSYLIRFLPMLCRYAAPPAVREFHSRISQDIRNPTAILISGFDLSWYSSRGNAGPLFNLPPRGGEAQGSGFRCFAFCCTTFTLPSQYLPD